MAARFTRSAARTRQQGVVLIVTMVALLLVTTITLSTLESSTINTRIALVQEVDTAAFQAAESGLRIMGSTVANLGPPDTLTASRRSYSSSTSGDPLPTLKLRGTVNIVTAGTAVFERETAAMGYSVRKGGTGFQTYVYELATTATVNDSISTSSTVNQGIFVDAPRID